MRIASKTKNVAVYERLRQDIVKGKMKPGQKIVMSELSKEFGLSETPSGRRSAGWKVKAMFVSLPTLGALVSELTRRSLSRSILIRIELEALVTRLAAAPSQRKISIFYRGRTARWRRPWRKAPTKILAA